MAAGQLDQAPRRRQRSGRRGGVPVFAALARDQRRCHRRRRWRAAQHPLLADSVREVHDAMNEHGWLAALVVVALAQRGAQARSDAHRDRRNRAEPPPASGARPAVAYEQLAGRAFGELDPSLPGNAIIQDIELAKDADGKVRYVASFVVYKPVDASKASGLMWHDVPNRGRVVPVGAAGACSRATSCWPAPGRATTPAPPRCGPTASGRRHAVPAVAGGARTRTARAITGEVFGAHRQSLRPGSQPLMVQTNPVPYKPVSPRHQQGTLVSRARRNPARRGHRRGRRSRRPTGPGRAAMPSTPFPGTPDATQICLKNGFDADAAVPGGVHRGRPVCARHRLRGLARRRRVLQERAGRRPRHAQPDRRAGHAQHHARHLAVGQLPARLAAPGLQPRAKPARRCTTACGRSSRAGASR